VGTQGRIEVEIPFNVPSDRPTRVLVTAGGDPPVSPATTELTFDPANQYTLQAEAFGQAILDGTPAPVPPSDAVATLAVIEAIRA
jgi:predicted dehydrogenase